MLVNHFGVSRTVVRGAISRLKSLGLIQTRQGSGASAKAARFSPLQFDAGSQVLKRAVIQMQEVRRAFEAGLPAFAAERRNDEDIKRIHRAEQALDRAAGAGDYGAIEDVALHRAIADAAQNQFLINTLD